jgi:hypothetical protein
MKSTPGVLQQTKQHLKIEKKMTIVVVVVVVCDFTFFALLILWSTIKTDSYDRRQLRF